MQLIKKYTLFCAGLVVVAMMSACPAAGTNKDGGLGDGGTLGDGGILGDGGVQPKLSFQASNVTLTGHDLLGLGAQEIVADCDIGTDPGAGSSCFGSGVTDWISPQSDGSSVHVFVVGSLHIEQNATVTVSGGLPLVLVSMGDFSLLGKIHASGVGGTPGPGGYYPPSSYFTKGNGPGGGPGGVANGGGPNTANGFAGLSAGGGSFCGLGGKGAKEAGGAVIEPAATGPVYGSADLRPLLAGSSGGVGGLSFAGGGGGALQLVAAGTFNVGLYGSINVGGGGGDNSGLTNGSQQSSAGGSGGALLIEAPTVVLGGSVAANGGGGGGRSSRGADATASLTAALGGMSDGVAIGGSGSAGASAVGGGGVVATEGAAGAGGGGSGWLRINSTGGSATVTGSLSPTLATACATQGALRAATSGQ